MSWSKIVASYLVSFQLILGPVLAHANAPSGETNNSPVSDSNKLNYDSRLDLANNKMYFVDRENQKVVGEAVLQDEKSLQEYSPKNLNQKLSAGIANLKLASKTSALHAWKSFPTESAAFFLALGGMTAVQLLTNYADNPIGMKQHIEHSLSPVGQLGFFMFMYTQGVTANTLNLWLKNPKLGMPIGMIGMTVGMAVQTYFSQVVADPHIRACVASVFKGEKVESDNHPCEGAYKYLVVDKKILEGPGIASLLGSFLVVTGARMAIGTVLRIVGIELSTLLVPGGLEVKGARWLLALANSSVNAAAFTVVQMKLEHIFSYAWKNYFDGRDFVHLNDDLVSRIEEQKKTHWKSSTAEFNKDLKAFSKKMSEWRANNLSEAYMANQAWSAYLGELTAMYNASFHFYNTYVEELLAKDSLIDRPYPLFGVTPKGLADGHNDNYLNRPDRIENMQVETINDVANWIQQNIQNGYYKKLGFVKFQMDILAKIQAGLASPDLNQKGKALLELNEARRKYGFSSASLMRFVRELTTISTYLGNPNPLYEKGRGYASSMLLSPSTMETYKGVKFEGYRGRFKTPNVTDYFVMQMICGPDLTRGESAISIVKGFPAKFSPPTIALDDEAKNLLCMGTASESIGNERIYNMPYSNSRTVPEYLRANINPQVARNFKTWWEENTEAQMKAAFKSFGASYKEIIEKLFRGLNETKNSKWNRGFISNGALVASFQEIRVYSLILGEMLKDTYKDQNKASLPATYFNSQPDPIVTLSASDYSLSKKPLLGLLARGSRYDFNTLVGPQPNAEARSLKIQRDLENSFALLNGLIQKARTQKVTAEEYQNQIKAIEAKLSEFSGLLGVSKEDTSAELVQLSGQQKTLAVTCLELLQALSQELALYGNMVGTARF